MISITSAEELSKYLKEPRFTLKDTGVKHWLIRYLEKNGLLLKQDEEESGNWRKFDFSELIWLRLVSELRKLSIGAKMLKVIREELFIRKSLKELGTSNAELKSRAIDVFESQGIEIPAEMKELFESQDFLERMGAIQTSYIESFLIMILRDRLHYSLFFSGPSAIESKYKKGSDTSISMSTVCLEHAKEMLSTEEYQDLFTTNGIMISLNSLLVDVLDQETVKVNHTDNIVVLNKKERIVWQAIRSGKYKAITIFFGKDKDPLKMELKEVKKAVTEARFIDYIYKNGYQRMEVEIEDGEVVGCVNTIKHKL